MSGDDEVSIIVIAVDSLDNVVHELVVLYSSAYDKIFGMTGTKTFFWWQDCPCATIRRHLRHD